MNQFKSSAFGGYRKSEVDSYVNDLMDQMEQLKDNALKNHENAKKYEQESETLRIRLTALEAQLEEMTDKVEAAYSESMKKEAASREQYEALQAKYDTDLAEQKAYYESRIEKLEGEYQEKASAMAQQSQRAEDRYAAADKVMMLAEQTAEETKEAAKAEAQRAIQAANIQAATTRSEADAQAEKTRSDAEAEAKRVLFQARTTAEKLTQEALARAQNTKAQTEAAFTERSNQMTEKYQRTRAGIREYIDALNNSEEKLLEVHRGMVSLIQQMPLSLDDFAKMQEAKATEVSNTVVSFGEFKEGV